MESRDHHQGGPVVSPIVRARDGGRVMTVSRRPYLHTRDEVSPLGITEILSVCALSCLCDIEVLKIEGLFSRNSTQ